MAHQYSSPSADLAFINADWLDFQSTPLRQENRENAIFVFDYERILKNSGWNVQRMILVPLPTQRFHEAVTEREAEKVMGSIKEAVDRESSTVSKLDSMRLPEVPPWNVPRFSMF